MQPLSESKVVAVPNVTPMIDVMMVLLIIFMVVTPSLLSGVVAEPPVGEHLQPRPVEEGDHTLAIDVHGALYLDKKPVAWNSLGAALAAMYPDSATDRMLFVRAHRTLRYQRIDEALDIARNNGVRVVGLVTEQRPRPE
jgi:biopolymer transport protein TolR